MSLADPNVRKIKPLAGFWGFMVAAMVAAHGVAEAAKEPRPGPNGTFVERYLLEYVVAKLNPAADRAGEVGGDPPAIPLYKGDELLGYAFDTWDVVEAVGYSRKPFHILGAFGLDGVITGAHLARHLEPITLLGRDDDDIREYLAQFPGAIVAGGVQVMFDGAVREGTRSNAEKQVDGISRATTSSMLFADAILRGARRVARARGIELQTSMSGRQLDLEIFELQSWPQMQDDGALSHVSLTNRAVAAAFDDLGLPPPAAVNRDEPAAEFATLWVGLVNPAGIGINLLGRRGYRRYAVGRSLADSGIFVAAGGPAAVLPADGETALGAALTVVQGDQRFALTAARYEPVMYFDGDAQPDNIRQAMFHLAADEGFDPTRPWRIEMTVPPAAADGAAVAGATFPIDYRLPARFVIGADPDEEVIAIADSETAGAMADVPPGASADPPESEPAAAPEMGAAATAEMVDQPDIPTGPNWQRQWRNQQGSVILLGVTIVILLLILSLQEIIVRRPGLHVALRVAFLAWTVGWVGWTVGAQLSVIHVMNWIESISVGVDWAFFMMEPLIFMLSAFVIIAALLWGRAAFCGWMCPFGALQELLNRLAVRLRVPQIELPVLVAERLTAVKYMIFVALVGLTFYSTELAFAASGVEPFKAAITFRFDAPATAVAYALGLLAIGLFIERFYCRFICPLGAGLALLGRLRMFNWLKRRAECGNPCSRCENKCPVRAIRKDGTIDMNECFYCLDCQVVYYDAHQCPPLIKRRKRGEAISGALPTPEFKAAE